MPLALAVLGTAGGHPYIFLFVAAANAIVLPVSGIVTGITILASDDTRSTHQRTANLVDWRCPTPVGGMLVTATLPSGATVEGKTNGDGRVVLVAPETEAAAGVAMIRVHGVEPRAVGYVP